MSTDLLDLLDRRLNPQGRVPEWIVAHEVEYLGRRADAVALNLWSSRGHVLHGFEEKASRSDWLAELKQPDKSEPFFRVCDQWWVLAPSVEVVKPEELPERWGLLVLRGGSLVAARKAQNLQPVRAPLPTSFVASFSRRCFARGGHHGPCQRQAADEYRRGFEAGKRDAGSATRNDDRRYEGLAEQVRKFQEASGVRGLEWNGKECGRAFDLIRQALADSSAARPMADRMERAAAALRELSGAAMTPCSVTGGDDAGER